MDRKGSAVWQGSIREGKGEVSTESGALKSVPYTFSGRFESGPGTNPEELLGAAHAACFSMAFSGQLGGEKLTAERIATTATVTIEKVDGGFGITHVHLAMEAKIPGVDKATFYRLAGAAKAVCPVSKRFDTKMTVAAKVGD